MKAILSKSMLKRISQDIQSGRPLWGIFTANEYLDPNDPLRLALTATARDFLRNDSYQDVPELILAAMAGKTVSQLRSQERQIFHSLKEKAAPNLARSRFVFTNKRASWQKSLRSTMSG